MNEGHCRAEWINGDPGGSVTGPYQASFPFSSFCSPRLVSLHSSPLVFLAGCFSCLSHLTDLHFVSRDSSSLYSLSSLISNSPHVRTARLRLPRGPPRRS